MGDVIKPRITAAVLVENNGKFLLAERNKQNYNGYWVVPGGGVKFGESLEDAARREIREEVGIEVELVKSLGYKELINVPGNYHSIVFFFLAKPKQTELQVSDGEDISSAKFLSMDEIKQLKIAESVEWVLKEAGFWV